MTVDQLIEDYERRLITLRGRFPQEKISETSHRLRAKAECYVTFISDLKKLEQTTTLYQYLFNGLKKTLMHYASKRKRQRV